MVVSKEDSAGKINMGTVWQYGIFFVVGSGDPAFSFAYTVKLKVMPVDEKSNKAGSQKGFGKILEL